jgi:hypothetical protein
LEPTLIKESVFLRKYGANYCGDCLLPCSSELFVFLSSTKNVNIRIYKTRILPAVLYGCESWSLTLKAEHRLWLYENMVLRRTFGLKQEELRGITKKTA